MANKKVIRKKNTRAKKLKIIFVRVYITEGDRLLKPIMAYLHDQTKIRGVTIFRAISGFGKSGAFHSSEILSMSLDLPVVIEFFDDPKKTKKAIQHLTKMLDFGHIVSWQGECA